MAYLAPSKTRSLDVTDSFNLAGTDVLTALNALQTSDLATAAAFSTKQDALPNISNVSSINQDLSTTSNVRFNQVNLGANGFITIDDGGAQLLISGGLTNASRYVVIRPYSPGSGGSALQYTAGSFQITKADGSGVSMYINNNMGDVGVDGLSVTRPVILGSMNTNAGCAVRKDYVDGLATTTAGTGLTKTGNVLSVNGAQTLSALTMTGPVVASSALAAPTFTIWSAGTKAVFFSNMSASTVDFAVGTETDNLWFSTGSASTGFKWYAGMTSVANMDGAGNMTLNGYILCNRVSVSNVTPTAGSHLTSKTYVDGLSFLTAGTGLTKRTVHYR